ncbi:TniQ family protein [Thalassotalea aquiviva]|uniref:TniQ family protein n=1 Tax=Thalassotalea aquiviva TaxID=3242415 RepID=UPI00352B5DF3
MMLSIRPKQLHDENVIGYIYRLSLANGFQNLYQWLPRSIATSLSHGHLSATNSKYIQNLTGCQLNTQTRLYKGNLSPLFAVPIFSQPRICPKCIEEYGYYKQSWQYLEVLICSKHQCLLLGTCHCCDKQLEWGERLITGYCTNPDCGKRLQVRNIPLTLVNLTFEQALDCLLAHYFLLNPGIALIKRDKVIKPHHFNRNLRAGLELLKNLPSKPSRFDELTNIIQSNCGYPDSIRLFPINLFVRNLYDKNWPIVHKLKGIATTRVEEGNNLNSMVMFSKHVAELLGVNLTELKRITDVVLPELAYKKKLSAIYPLDIKSFIQPLIDNRQSIVDFEVFNSAKQKRNQARSLYQGIYFGKLKFNYHPKDSLQNSIMLSCYQVKHD